MFEPELRTHEQVERVSIHKVTTLSLSGIKIDHLQKIGIKMATSKNETHFTVSTLTRDSGNSIATYLLVSC